MFLEKSSQIQQDAPLHRPILGLISILLAISQVLQRVYRPQAAALELWENSLLPSCLTLVRGGRIQRQAHTHAQIQGAHLS